MAEIVVHTENLCYAFGGMRVIDSLDLEVPAGTIFGLLGPTGAGKSTTVRLLLGLLQPTAGHAYVLGFDTRGQGESIRQRTGALLEHAGLYMRLTAEGNLDFYGRIWHMSGEQRATRKAELVRHFRLQDRMHESVAAWDAEMQRRLSVARAFLHRPALVFLDEPTRGLDPQTSAELRRDLANLVARERTTLFLTTSNLAEAEALCEWVGVLQQGRLLAVATPAELRRRAAVTHLEVRGRGLNDNVALLLRKRPEVTYATCRSGQLVVELVANADPQPLVSLLLESNVDVNQVCQSRTKLETLLAGLAEEGA